MKPYEGYLLCTDVDGTLVGGGNEISRENIQAIKRFMDGGGIFTVATGRTPMIAATIFTDFLPNAPIAAHNGASVYDLAAKEYLHTAPLGDTAEELLMYVEETFDCAGFEVYHYDDIYRRGTNDYIANYIGAERLPGAAFAEMPKPWTKAVLAQSEEDTARIAEHLAASKYAGSYNFNKSGGILLEIMSVGASKGAALLRIKEMLGAGIHTTIGMGDYENDISMLRVCDVSYAVGNATDEVKRAARHVTVRHTEHAVAKVIEGISLRGIF
ncbi:MAG: Cof-type HAD-IIB family hydrolase [Clostridiales bacterium]|jgi:Cof subfamily protein (haloacid dehalogenase superfamily)|nr:Cof-type HAD-IIB family hydrolase [Clostridiales bacterium]